MKKLAIVVGVLVVLLVAALAAVPFFVPMEPVKSRIAEAARDATGRELSVGDLSLSVFPRIEIDAAEVALANAPGADREHMATVRRLLIRLNVLALLFSREIAVDSFVLVEPEIHLEVDESGRPNWALAGGTPMRAEPAEPVEPEAQPAPAPAEAAEAPEQAAGIAGLRLGDVRIESGLLTYADAASGQGHEVSDIELALALEAFDQPLTAEGRATWRGEEIALRLDADNLRALSEGAAAEVALSLRGRPLSLGFEGSLAVLPAVDAEGQVDLDVPSLRELAAWAAEPIEQGGSGLGPLAITGRVAIEGETYAFEDATIRLDAMTGTGRLAAALGGPRPRISGALAVDLLDLNPDLPAEKAAEPGAQGSGGAAPAAGQGQTGGAQPKAAEAGTWSDEPIDLSALKAVDADLALELGGIRVRDIKVGRSALDAKLENGRLVADLKELNLYNGRGEGRLVVDGRGAVPAVEKRLALKDVTLEPLLSDAAGFDRLEGSGGFDLAVETRGRSQRAMVAALGGRGAIQFRDGAIKGINLAAMIRNIDSAFRAADEAQKTDFAELSGTFQIAKGVLNNDDLKLLNPLIRVTGKGRVNLPARTLKYRIEPKAVTDLKGQGGDLAARGLAVPVIAEGPWHDITYRPDIVALIGKPADTLKGTVEGLTSPLTGEGGGTDAAKDTLKDAGDALKNLFGN